MTNPPDPIEVLPLLPQREPVALVDEVLECEPGGFLRARHRVPRDADYFSGHFPGDPVVPGVVQFDALFQAAGLLALATEPELASGRVLLMGLDRARFRRRVGPGDDLALEVRVRSQRGPVWKVDAKASVQGEPATEVRLLLNATTADAR